MYLSRVSSPVRLASLLSFFPFWGVGRGEEGSLPVSLPLCGAERWAGDQCAAPGWAIFLF